MLAALSSSHARIAASTQGTAFSGKRGLARVGPVHDVPGEDRDARFRKEQREQFGAVLAPGKNQRSIAPRGRHAAETRLVRRPGRDVGGLRKRRGIEYERRFADRREQPVVPRNPGIGRPLARRACRERRKQALQPVARVRRRLPQLLEADVQNGARELPRMPLSAGAQRKRRGIDAGKVVSGLELESFLVKPYRLGQFRRIPALLPEVLVDTPEQAQQLAVAASALVDLVRDFERALRGAAAGERLRQHGLQIAAVLPALDRLGADFVGEERFADRQPAPCQSEIPPAVRAVGVAFAPLPESDAGAQIAQVVCRGGSRRGLGHAIEAPLLICVESSMRFASSRTAREAVSSVPIETPGFRNVPPRAASGVCLRPVNEHEEDR